jgi:hypothetical protein
MMARTLVEESGVGKIARWRGYASRAQRAILPTLLRRHGAAIERQMQPLPHIEQGLR